MKLKLLLSGLLSLILLLQSVQAQGIDEGQIYVVTGKESLSGLANRFYNDLNVWPAIWKATNAKARQDNRFLYITDPNTLQPGQWLWIPPEAELPQWLNGYVPPKATLQPLTPAMLQDLADYTENLRQTFDIPGAALAVVADNQIQWAQGFGVRELGRPDPVTPETMFAIASTTKAINSMLLAMLVDDGLFTWDTPVQEIWPEFKTGPSIFTETLRLRHLLAMNSGLPREDLVWSDTHLTAEQLMASLENLTPWAAPGETFLYNNQTVATAGYLGALKAGGQYGQLGAAYNDLLQQRVFKPIGMTQATLALSEVLANPNHATPHDYTLAQEVLPIPYNIDASIMPAGGVQANVLDLGRFLITEINGGITPEGRRIVTTRSLSETWQPQIDISLDRSSYGMGWIIERYRGVTIIWHEGDVLGFKALIAFYPEAKVGLVFLSNRLLSKWLAYGVLYHFTEMLYGLPDSVTGLYLQQYQAFTEAVAASYATLSPTVIPAQVITYTGHYAGGWQVTLRPDNTLWVTRGATQWRLLLAYDGDKPYYRIYNGFGFDSPLQFNETDAGISLEFWLSSGEHGIYDKEKSR